jgi:hypothetical protein
MIERFLTGGSLLLGPTPERFRRLQTVSANSLLASLISIVLASFLLSICLTAFGAGLLEVLETSFALTILSFCWAVSAAAICRFKAPENTSPFEPILYMQSTSLLMAFLIAMLVSLIPYIGMVLSIAVLIYIFVVTVLAFRYFTHMSVIPAVLASIGAFFMAFVAAFIFYQLVYGMKHMVER